MKLSFKHSAFDCEELEIIHAFTSLTEFTLSITLLSMQFNRTHKTPCFNMNRYLFRAAVRNDLLTPKNLTAVSQGLHNTPCPSSVSRTPAQQHDIVSGGQRGESSRTVQMSHIDSAPDHGGPPSIPPSLHLPLSPFRSLCLSLSFCISFSLLCTLPPSASDRRCASPSLKAKPLPSWGNRNGAITFRLARAHLCFLLSSCFQASKSSKFTKKRKRGKNLK